MWEIAKEFDFCYGHRVWSQKLKEGYATDLCLSCRHLHGHQGKIIVYIRSDKLEDGMVTDFKHLGWFKKWLDDTLDHKFIMDLDDPLRSNLFPLSYNSELQNEGHRIVQPDVYKHLEKELVELYEGLILVPFVPTSENLSKWLLDIIQEKMNPLGVKVSQVKFYETPKSQSNYYA